MTKRATIKEAITPAAYRVFQEAYDFFNAELFAGSLPPVLVTLQRHAKARAYFSPERFSGRNEARVTAHELAMNPDSFTGRTDESILSTLAHEMAHVWQQTHGTPPRRFYHDRQWAAKMKEIGLQPSTTGAPGGKETGQSVTYYIIPGGPYAKAYTKLKARGFQLHWQSAPQGKQAKAKKASKTKFTCLECGQNAWAKPDALLICGNCYEDGEGTIEGALIEGNLVHGNDLKGLSIISAPGARIQNNVIYENGDAAGGVHLVDEPGCNKPTTDAIVVNNTIDEPSMPGIQMNDGATDNIIFNNLIVEYPDEDPILDEVGGNHIGFNYIAASTEGVFEDLATDDYHLAEGSPAIDFGVATFVGADAPALDYDGVIRPQGSAYDAGAYERAGMPSSR